VKVKSIYVGWCGVLKGKAKCGELCYNVTNQNESESPH